MVIALDTTTATVIICAIVVGVCGFVILGVVGMVSRKQTWQSWLKNEKHSTRDYQRNDHGDRAGNVQRDVIDFNLDARKPTDNDRKHKNGTDEG